MRKRKWLFLLLAAILVKGYSQNNWKPEIWKDYHPETPEASKMPSYVDVPVNYTRGVVETTIPLYVIETGEISLPITLNYNHKGIRVAELNEVLGVGWDLKAEPKVVRSVNGQPDYRMAYSTAPPSGQYKLHEAYNGRYGNSDGLPDQYYYSLAEKSGSYLLKTSSGQTKLLDGVTIPYDPIKVQCNGETNWINIIDENGVSYTFGGTAATEHTTRYPAVWKATSITASNRKDSITFTYGNSQWQNLLEYNDIFSIIFYQDIREGHHNNRDQEVRMSSFDGTASIYGYDIQADPTSATMNMFKPVYVAKGTSYGTTSGGIVQHNRSLLEKIKYSNGEVEFIYNNRRLEEIRVKDSKGNKKKGIYLHQRGVADAGYIALDSIIIKDGDGNKLDSYRFTYNSFPIIKGHEKGANFWGYFTTGLSYDGRKKSFINTTKVRLRKNFNLWTSNGRYEVEIPGQDRESAASSQGMLKTITNSIGAVTTFYYETDKYKKIIPPFYEGEVERTEIKETGGLRISSIEHSDPLTNEKITRKFKYGALTSSKKESESGLGIVRRNINPDAYMYKQTIENGFGGYSQDMPMYSYTSHLLGNWTFGGDPVVYDQVTEYRVNTGSDGNSTNGRTVYKFNYPLDDNGQWDKSYMLEQKDTTNIVFDKKDTWKFGQLISKEIYDETDKLVLETKYEYKQVTPYTQIPFPNTWQIFKSWIYLLETTDNKSFVEKLMSGNENYRPYVVYYSTIGSGAMKLISEKEIQYAGSNSITKLTEYTYANSQHSLPTTIKTTYDDKGGSVTKKLKYVQDDKSTDDSDHVTARTKLIERGIIAPIIEDETVSGNSKHVNTSRYKEFDNDLVLPHKMFSQRDGGAVEERGVIHKYDYYGKPLYTTEDGSHHKVYIWSYRGTRPVAVIEGSTYEQVETALNALGAESDFFNKVSKKSIPADSDLEKMEKLRTKLSASLVYVHYYEEFTGKILWSSNERGIKIYYDYDSSGRVICIYHKDASGKKEIIETYEYNFRKL